jgi:hypothetical protein
MGGFQLHSDAHRRLYRLRYGPAADFVFRYKALAGFGKNAKLPWESACKNIRYRCTKPGTAKYEYYGGRGIKFQITKKQLMEAFMRDKAYLMLHPSVDRIDTNGHYAPENIRWIEFSENRKRRLERGLSL